MNCTYQNATEKVGSMPARPGPPRGPLNATSPSEQPTAANAPATSISAPTSTLPDEVPSFKTRCNRIGLSVPGDNPSPTEMIPHVEKRLADHMRHVGRTMNPWTGDYCDWKARHDGYVELLTDLRAAQEEERKRSIASAAEQQQISRAFQKTSAPTSTPHPRQPRENKFPSKNPAQSDSTVANQRPDGDSKVIRSDSEVISADSDLNPSDSKITSSDSESLQNRADAADFGTPCNPFPADTHQQSDVPTANPTKSEKTATGAPPIDITNYFDRDDLQVALDLQQHLSGRSPLDHIPANHQQAIIGLLEDYPAWRVAKVIAQPSPRGLGIQTTVVALNRFRRRYNAAQGECLKQQTLKASQDLVAQANGSDDTFQAAVQRLMKIRLLTLASNPNAGVDQIDSLITSLTKLRKQFLAERKQLHAERKQ